MAIENVRTTGLPRPAILSFACLGMEACLLVACLALSRSFAAQGALARSWSAGASGLTIGAMLILAACLACGGVTLGTMVRRSTVGVTALVGNALVFFAALGLGAWLFSG
jgi:hypothetical protein